MSLLPEVLFFVMGRHKLAENDIFLNAVLTTLLGYVPVLALLVADHFSQVSISARAVILPSFKLAQSLLRVVSSLRQVLLLRP